MPCTNCQHGATCKKLKGNRERCVCNQQCHKYTNTLKCTAKYGNWGLEEISYDDMNVCELARSNCLRQESQNFVPIYDENKCYELEDLMSEKIVEAQVEESRDKGKSSINEVVAIMDIHQFCDHGKCNNNGICLHKIRGLESEFQCECQNEWKGDFCDEAQVQESKDVQDLTCSVINRRDVVFQLLTVIFLWLIILKLFCPPYLSNLFISGNEKRKSNPITRTECTRTNLTKQMSQQSDHHPHHSDILHQLHTPIHYHGHHSVPSPRLAPQLKITKSSITGSKTSLATNNNIPDGDFFKFPSHHDNHHHDHLTPAASLPHSNIGSINDFSNHHSKFHPTLLHHRRSSPTPSRRHTFPLHNDRLSPTIPSIPGTPRPSSPFLIPLKPPGSGRSSRRNSLNRRGSVSCESLLSGRSSKTHDDVLK